MKRFVCIVCLLALLLSACSVVKTDPVISAGNYTHGIYKLTFKTKMLSNDPAAHDWTFTYTHNDRTVKSGYTVSQSLGIFTFQSIGVEIRANNRADLLGTGTLHVAMCDGGSGETQITVPEANGGSTVWEITCQVKLIGKQ